MISDIGLLFARVGFGLTMLAAHGLPKFKAFALYAASFPDPIGVGSKFSLILAIFAELVCSALVVVGLGTRLAAIPLIITMLVAFGVIHGADPWQKKELALVYAMAFITLGLTGPGRLSLDGIIYARRKMKSFR